MKEANSLRAVPLVIHVASAAVTDWHADRQLGPLGDTISVIQDEAESN
jgi:hypothetical protein